jgi:hypothetical protein
MSAHIIKISAMANCNDDQRFIAGLAVRVVLISANQLNILFKNPQQDLKTQEISSIKLFWGCERVKHLPLTNSCLKSMSYMWRTFFCKRDKVEVNGLPWAKKDPRPDKKSCLKTTLSYKIKNVYYLYVYFKTLGITKYQQNVVHGWQDPIAFFGGIVGLCVGFSLLIGAELICHTLEIPA